MALTTVKQGGIATDAVGTAALDQDAGFTLAGLNGSSTIASEGGAVTTSVQQGIAKAWVNLDGGTNTIRDSLNIASMTDLGTGQPQINYSNNMNNDDYSVPFNTGGHNGVNRMDSMRGLENGSFTTSKCSFYSGAESNLYYYDSSNVHSSIFGDLA